MSKLEETLGDITVLHDLQRSFDKTDDIISFICKHWWLFSSSKSDVMQARAALGQQQPYTVDAMCSQLGINENIIFRRTKLEDIHKALVSFENSTLLKAFIKVCAMVDGPEACMICVCGESTIAITNMQTDYIEGCMHRFLKSKLEEMGDIHIIPLRDFQARLPVLFSHDA